MENYTAIAEYYDRMLKHVDYTAWYRFISSVMKQYVENPQTVLELGCGTGKFGSKFSNDNYLMYGLDISLDMLLVAKARAFKNFRLICSNMKNFKLAKPVDFIFCVHDALNYFTDKNDLRQVFRSVKNAMDNKSIFMFDITTEFNILNFFSDKTNKYEIRGTNIEWSNTYDEKNKIVYSYFKVLDRSGEIYNETHLQRIYSEKEIAEILSEEGLRLIDVFSDYSFHPPKKDTIMINFVTGKKK
jgi:ubiquinone/menaquinone biosynthesis C-methylase UbiE